MALTVLSVAYPFAPVSLDAVGGAEQVLALLDDALVSEGHRSLVIACRGSRIAGRLIDFALPEGALTPSLRERAHGRYRALVDRAIAEHAPDVVHLHGVDAYRYVPTSEASVLFTLHLPASFYPEGALLSDTRPSTFFNCVSESQRRTFPALPSMLDVVPNGIRVDDYAPAEAREDYFLMLGRICPEKGFHLILDAATRAGAKLTIAGQVFPYEEHERYFQDEIAPRLDDRRRFIGPIGRYEKTSLLARSRAVIIASTVPETSSLVAMEALASGAPVLARRIGALPELIEDGITGYLFDTEDELIGGMRTVNAIDSRHCRHVAEARCSIGAMARGYLAHYEAIRRMRGSS